MMSSRNGRLNLTTGGFTLIEVMITIGILTFGLLSLATVQIYAMRGGDRGRHMTHAAAIAESRMEQLQQDTWTSVGVTGGFVADPVEQSAVKLASGTLSERAYSVSHQITDLEPTFTREIDVRVWWAEKSGETRSVTLSSIRYNREGT